MRFTCGNYRVAPYNDECWSIEKYHAPKDPNKPRKHDKLHPEPEWQPVPFYAHDLRTTLKKLVELVDNDPEATLYPNELQIAVDAILTAVNDGVAAMTKEAMA